MLQGLVDEKPHFVGAERFQDVIEGAALHGLDRGLHGAVGGDDDDRQPGEVLAHPGEQLHASHAGHLQIGDDELEDLFVEGPGGRCAVGLGAAGLVARGLVVPYLLVAAEVVRGTWYPASGLKPTAIGYQQLALSVLFTALFIVFAILGAYMVAVVQLGLDGGTYFSSLEEAVEFGHDVGQSLTKALVFGALVAVVATYRGYTSEPTSAGVSASTTGTVVIASVAVLLSDYVITALWGV